MMDRNKSGILEFGSLGIAKAYGQNKYYDVFSFFVHTYWKLKMQKKNFNDFIKYDILEYTPYTLK